MVIIFLYFFPKLNNAYKHEITINKSYSNYLQWNSIDRRFVRKKLVDFKIVIFHIAVKEIFNHHNILSVN